MADAQANQDPEASRARAAPPALLLAGLHLAALSAFAIAQPLLNLLGKYPAFFAAHNSSSVEVIGFALVLIVVPPAGLLLVEALAGLASLRLRYALHLAFVAGLAALFFLQAVRKIFESPSWLPFVVALALGLAIAALYATESLARSLLSFLGAAPLLFGILFVFVAPVSKITLAGSAKAYSVAAKERPPIVLLMFDAFPESTLMDRRRRIDPVRYPNLARLAGDGTWYRNATTAHENTVFSVPSILDGRFPRKGTQPISSDHPTNLFTLLGKGYEMNVTEVATNLCPPGLCKRTDARSWSSRMKLMAEDVGVVYGYLTLPQRLQNRLPAIDDKWQNFRGGGGDAGAVKARQPGAKDILGALRGGQRPALFRNAISKIERGRPELNFAHVLLPHEPREYLPDGRRYPAGWKREPALEAWPAYDNRFLTDQEWQRTLLQVGLVDTLVGEMTARLKRLGIYDDALVVVVSDHGESFIKKATPAPPFVTGKLGFRRAVTRENIQDIAPIPLIVKYPRSTGRKGDRIDDRWVKTIDILPTIADTLGIRLPFKVDGRSLLSKRYRGRTEVRVERTSGPDVVMDLPTFEQRRAASLARKLALFGSDDDKPGLYGFGPDRELLGRRPAELSVTAGGGASARIEGAAAFAGVVPRATEVPAMVAGAISGEPPENRRLAVALNGRIVATGLSFKTLGDLKLNFSVMIPASALRPGRNRVEVYEVTSPGTLKLLARAG